MKKEAVITIIAAIILTAVIVIASGCAFPGKTLDGSSANDWKMAQGINELKEIDGCLLCVGCVNMKSSAGCCGNSKYSYVGCVDCLGVCSSDDSEEYVKYINGCGGCSCVSIPLGSGSDKSMIGCYTES